MTTDNDKATAGIITMVNTSQWYDHSSAYLDSQAHKAQAASLKQEAARALAPLIEAMRAAGMFDANAGFRVALANQVPSIDWDPRAPVTSAVTERLTRARQMISERVNLLTLPEALIFYGHGVMPLLGHPVAGRIWEPNDGSPYEVF